MKGQTIIIKKVKKGGHAAAHGGSWKVAYADFVTAMMAFFLLMWLINMTSPEKKLKLSTYFKTVGIMEAAGLGFMGKGKDILDTSIVNPAEELAEKKGDSFYQLNKEEFKEKLKKDIEDKLGAVKDQVMVDVIEGGVRINIVDKLGKPMFTIGSSELAPEAKSVLKLVSEEIREFKDLKISVEGHTDSTAYSGNKYTNWELSTDRASAARRELEKNNIDPNDLAKVSGFAATQPLIADKPNDPRNRRISLLLLSTDQAAVEKLTGKKSGKTSSNKTETH
ncbi:OmpA family protein [Candidatus Magnetomonas plexicatena]|uniref:OmpA family protein n=1 Tax=Candidatus Magnetomonas plexicatena TaxID=2552947 RepID=UPI001C78BCCB|nr:OmpA family protein [Nitrospirales bacterium LBB_01]